jgi:hypothetical protein
VGAGRDADREAALSVGEDRGRLVRERLEAATLVERRRSTHCTNTTVDESQKKAIKGQVLAPAEACVPPGVLRQRAATTATGAAWNVDALPSWP